MTGKSVVVTKTKSKGMSRSFRAIWLAPVLALISLTAWAVASPIGASPDDDFHLVSIWCADSGKTWACDAGTSATNRVAPEALVKSSVCFAHHPAQNASCQKYTFGLDPTPTQLTDRGNFVGEYPPIYYMAMNLFVTPSIEFSVVLMRLVNAIIFVGLTSALFLLLKVDRRPALVWGWLASTIPLGIFLIPSNNPSSWAIIGVGSAWLALLGYMNAYRKRKIALGALFALSVLMAAGARGDGALYVGFAIAVGLFLSFRNDRRYWLNAILPVAMGLVAAFFLLSSNQSQTGIIGFSSSVSTSATGVEAASKVPDSFGSIFTLLFSVPSLWAGVFGYWGLGWFDTSMPAIVTFGAIAIAVGVVFTGLRVASWRKMIALGATGLLLVVIPTWVLYRGGQQVGTELQPRYLLPLIVLFIGISMVAVGHRVPLLTRAQRVLVGVTLSVVQMVALYMNMRRYIHGDANQAGWNLDQNTFWWWNIVVSPMAVLAIGSLAFAAMTWILIRELAATTSSCETGPVEV